MGDEREQQARTAAIRMRTLLAIDTAFVCPAGNWHMSTQVQRRLRRPHADSRTHCWLGRSAFGWPTCGRFTERPLLLGRHPHANAELSRRWGVQAYVNLNRIHHRPHADESDHGRLLVHAPAVIWPGNSADRELLVRPSACGRALAGCASIPSLQLGIGSVRMRTESVTTLRPERARAAMWRTRLRPGCDLG